MRKDIVAERNTLFYLNYEECKGLLMTGYSSSELSFILTMRNVKMCQCYYDIVE